jgi:hypothetical protein
MAEDSVNATGVQALLRAISASGSNPLQPDASRYNAAVAGRLVARRWVGQRTLAVPVAAALLIGGCATPPPAAPEKEVVVWKNLGEWSGRGNAQTESFIGLTGALRMHWRTNNEAPGGNGTFRLILQSAISGRELQAPVDEQGHGEGTAYVAEDPRAFYMSVESANLDWSFTVEEAIFGIPVENAEDPD